ncbi:MAG TPA: ATP synthase F0 subunit B [Polyangiaceae bacterium]|jgi:F-type H+-transporting ATPase subunit b
MSLVSVTDLGSVLSSSSSTVMDAITGARMSAGGSAVEVDFDATVIFMVVLFLILWVILKPVLFDPMLRLFEERERRIDGAKLLARKIDQKSANALAEYEDQMQKARTAANAEREKIRAEGLKREAEILARVRAETAKTLEDGRKQMKDDMARARVGLEAEMGSIAAEFASRALGREVRG